MSVSDPFDSFGHNHLAKLADDPIARMLYPGVDVRVLASQISPRHPAFAWVMDTSRGVVEALFDGKAGRSAIGLATEHMRIYFPERWMSPKECVEFVQRLWENPIRKRANTKRFDLMTGSPVILTDFSNTMVKVITEIPNGTVFGGGTATFQASIAQAMGA